MSIDLLSEELVERFWSRVDKSGECWLWLGRDLLTNGYGMFTLQRRDPRIRLFVHRVSYFLDHGVLDDGMVVHHTCETKLCVNPAHLQAMTKAEHAHLHHAGRTHCRRGHPFTPSNTYSHKLGRQCAQCVRERQRERYATDPVYRQERIEHSRRQRERA